MSGPRTHAAVSAMRSVTRPVAGRAGAGFTLVEVLVALAILSLLMVTVLAALRTFGNTQSSLDRMTSRVDEVRTVSSFLRDALAASVPGRGGGSRLGFGGDLGAAEASHFRGDSQGFEWKARLLLGENFGGTYMLRVARQGDALVLQWQEYGRAIITGRWDDAQSRVLVTALEELDLAYRGAPDQPWQPGWEPDDLPQLVRLNIRARERYWPELIVGVKR